MKNNFYNLNQVLDKKKDSSTHKSQYLGELKNFDLDYHELEKSKNLFKKTSDLKIIEEILLSLKNDKKLPFVWTHQESFYLNNCNSIKSKIDYLIYRYKFKIFPERKLLSDFPIHVLIEPTSICNLRCVMCYQMDNKFTGDNIKKMETQK